MRICSNRGNENRRYLSPPHVQGEGDVIPDIILRILKRPLSEHLVIPRSFVELVPKSKTKESQTALNQDGAWSWKERRRIAVKFMNTVNCFLPVCPTHGLWPPDEDVFVSSVSTDSVRVIIRQLGILWEVLVIIRAVDQHRIHHFLFVQGRLEHAQDGWGTRAKLEANKQVSV